MISALRSRRFPPSVSKVAIALAGVLLTSACSVRPEPVTPEEQAARAFLIRDMLFDGQEPLDGPVTLYEAIARGLKYNLDQRLALMEQALQTAQLDLTETDMLPRLAADAGYMVRSNTLASSSYSILSGRQSLEPSTSSEKEQKTASLQFSWNILDFGLSYYQAKQQADRVMIAQERRRRVVNNVVQEIRSAFWQAATGERLLSLIEPVLADAEEAVNQAREIERSRVGAPLQALEYQKALLEVVRQLRALRSDVITSKARLASLMNVAPGTSFTLVMPDEAQVEPPEFKVDMERLEMVALTHRPELREEDYQLRIGADEVRKAKLRLLPGVNLVASLNADANRFLVHNYWADAGVRVSYNLVNLLSMPRAIDLAKAQISVAETRQMALSIAVITQVNIAYAQYQQALEQYRQAAELNDVERRIFEQVSNAASADTEGVMDRIRRSVQSISAQLQRDRSFAEVQIAFGNIFASLGLDPLPDAVESTDVDSIAAVLRQVNSAWRDGTLPEVPVPAVEVEEPATAGPAMEVSLGG
ncbi:TolC family protein [Indioceanicola profundi]|uniref:TolC family protein n=1 Tax=Indioceanicola profundi TaxID=2220096 RepID=UPI000E6ABD9A|nr:TolC family protein [Indioceanicola profundi]